MTDDGIDTEGRKERVERKIRLRNEKTRLKRLADRLNALQYWTPAPELAGEVADTVSRIDAMEEQLEAKAVVAVIGGTGVGKSTLVNALCGLDGTVAEGISRPTTRAIAAVARSSGDADVLVAHFAPGELTVLADSRFRFRDVVLVDTPDTDSAECSAWSELLDRVLRRADVLLCVFDAMDPKRKDNLDRLAREVSKFPAKHVFLVLNRCDRIPLEELGEIRADFLSNTANAWSRVFEKSFCVSARAALGEPHWSEGEQPLHGTNEFNALCDAIRSLSGAQFADRRIERARGLRRETEAIVRNAAAGCGDWAKLKDDLVEFEAGLTRKLVESASTRIGRTPGLLSSLIYDTVAERWTGPVGMYLGLGRRIRGFFSPLRMLNPLHWLDSAFSALRGGVSGRRSESDAVIPEIISFNWNQAKGFVSREWQSLAARLCNEFKLSAELIDGEKAVSFERLEKLLRDRLPWLYESALERVARRRSGFLVQSAANFPFVAVAAYSLYQLLSSYFAGVYLPREYYLQAGAILLLLWLLPSWCVQAWVKGAASAVSDTVRRELTGGNIEARVLSVLREVEVVESLSREDTISKNG